MSFASHLLRYPQGNRPNACGTAQKYITGFPEKLICERLQKHQTLLGPKLDHVLALSTRIQKCAVFVRISKRVCHSNEKKEGLENVELQWMYFAEHQKKKKISPLHYIDQVK